ncbi:MAG: type II secretion system GspH family protein [Gammaproteobacteria bacterium]|nr:type II secretion system GspH family protein [Gammaproteobacteria bacterium]MCI0590382.1 type II secretion system GspH family protein [Gammaproteobacteria bacterium]
MTSALRRYKAPHKAFDAGFSLLEVLIVLFVLALLMGSVLAPLSTQMEQSERRRTQEILDQAREALYGFAITNGRLVCPDCRDNTGGCASVTANDGQEDRVGSPEVCATAVGNLPWVNLGVQGQDAWGRNFTYQVTTAFADDPIPSFTLADNGDITVKNAAGGSDIAQNIPANIVSHATNGAVMPPTSTHENENADADTVYVLKIYSRDPILEFDDLVTWISPTVLRNRMVASGRLP